MRPFVCNQAAENSIIFEEKELALALINLAKNVDDNDFKLLLVRNYILRSINNFVRGGQLEKLVELFDDADILV